jgi:hypothetical protein
MTAPDAVLAAPQMPGLAAEPPQWHPWAWRWLVLLLERLFITQDARIQ